MELREAEGEFQADVRKFVIDGDDGVWGLVETGAEGSRVITITAGTTYFDDSPPA